MGPGWQNGSPMLHCEWKKMQGLEDLGLPSICFHATQERNMYEGQDYKHDFTLENCCCCNALARQPHV